MPASDAAGLLAIRLLVPSAVRVTANTDASRRHRVRAVDAHGAPVALTAADTAAVGRWLATAFPGLDWRRPHVVKLADGTVHSPGHIPALPEAAASEPPR